ncbi:MAG TPA: chemotaxis protein CheA [Burkholderiaceae bacterium]|nr:chemotaxis protein CheA [Burkholderiaceae bacterium]
MSMELALQTYIAESRGLLEEMEASLLNLERAPNDQQQIDALFRAAHTIKGSAGLFGLDAIVEFTHVVENVLDRLREGELATSKTLIDVMLACADHMAVLIESVAEGGAELSHAQSQQGCHLLEQLQPFLEIAEPEMATPSPLPMTTSSLPASEEGAGGVWQVSVQFGQDVLRNGLDPVSFIRYLGTVGQLQDVCMDAERLPGLERMDAEACYLGFNMTVSGVNDRQTIEDVFEFVRDDCALSITPLNHARQSSSSQGDTPTDSQVAVAVAEDSATGSAGQALPAAEATGAAAHGTRAKASSGKPARFIRVNAEKLDELINLVGELVIAGASGALLARQFGNAALQEATASINGYIEHIREGALGLRMVEIGETFKRFQRVVRDVSEELGKDIVLEIQGADTELDKTVVEQIGDPLTHLVRNAIDHGIESETTRLARGKPAQGVVRLNAYHDSGNIVIEVSDDGGGLNVDKIRAKAIERGVIRAGDALTDREVCNLIFEPGFSTADSVTNLSGRGVGMDVVRKNIEALRGTVDLDSEEGLGTTVRVRLPLTLAIIDGFLASVGGSSYVVPLDAVLECMEMTPEASQVADGRRYFNLRGEVLPFMRLRDQFSIGGTPGRRENIIVVHAGDHKVGLVVDELLGEFQTVIKPLGKLFSKVRGISGSTILGSGEVALILDVPSLVAQAIDGERLHDTSHTAERH